jgi:hypothetical protein
MKEEFLHYIWQSHQFDHEDLHTTNGELVRIIKPGQLQFNSGPDFTEAQIQIGSTLWAGEVEIHLKSSDWYKHGHHLDVAYDKVILHACAEIDADIDRTDGTSIPQIELSSRIDEALIRRYVDLKQSLSDIPCGGLWHQLDHLTLVNGWHRFAVERLEERCYGIWNNLDKNKGNWDALFWEELCAAFGLKVNTDSFRLLARSIPIQILNKHRNNLKIIEALLFGQAGMLPLFRNNSYPRQLNYEYQHLRRLYNLEPLSPELFRFLRLRPANFPSLRIAQLAAYIHHNGLTLGILEQQKSLKPIVNELRIEPSKYWHNHYRFALRSKLHGGKMGESMACSIVNNALIPLLFAYGKYHDDQVRQDYAISLWDQLDPENNRIIRKFKLLGQEFKSAFETQAALQCHNKYCILKRCIYCPFGRKLLNHEKARC